MIILCGAGASRAGCWQTGGGSESWPCSSQSPAAQVTCPEQADTCPLHLIVSSPHSSPGTETHIDRGGGERKERKREMVERKKGENDKLKQGTETLIHLFTVHRCSKQLSTYY